jgi:hypothetical protein
MSLTSAQKPTLLLIDDDSIISDSLEYMLGDDYCIERAVDRQTSFDLLDRIIDSPTLALVDLGLPPNIHTPDDVLPLSQKHTPPPVFWSCLVRIVKNTSFWQKKPARSTLSIDLVVLPK